MLIHIRILFDEGDFDKIDLTLDKRDSDRKVLATTPYYQSAGTMISSSDALAIVPCPVARQLANDSRIAIRKAPGIIEPMDYWVLWHERSRRDPATTWLVDILCDSCQHPNG